ncbi:reverse transcriptase domain-containing protein [Selenomonas montiformis]|uniref:reverse transcriptase domain-containing protein n=1 Tax=Selenomonas montiformis TaxID=2652285 RepID=UPI0039F59FED
MKGVHREAESERRCRQISGLTNRNHIRLNPTVVDRVIQQAIAQILTPIYEQQFSETSFGFRPKRGAHDALKTCQRYADEGYVYVVDMDLERFFDTVCQSKLIEIL